MITKFKIFEDTGKYNIGDYVVCVEPSYPEIINYVGEIVSYDGYNNYVQYDYDKLPDHMKMGFRTYGGLGIRPYPDREIVRKLPDDEADLIRNQKKFNL